MTNQIYTAADSIATLGTPLTALNYAFRGNIGPLSVWPQVGPFGLAVSLKPQ
jgi:hypothetical protein